MGVSHNAVVSRIKTGKFDTALFEDGSVNEALATTIWNENPTKRPASLLAPDGQPRTKIKQASTDGANEYKIKLERMQVAFESEKIALERLRETTVDREEMKRQLVSLEERTVMSYVEFSSSFWCKHCCTSWM